jgi:hypothetical protein
MLGQGVKAKSDEVILIEQMQSPFFSMHWE